MLYRIAEFPIEISFSEDYTDGTSLIPSFTPFVIGRMCKEESLLLRLYVDDKLQPKKENRERIGDFDTGNGNVIVDRFPDSSYQYIIKDLEGRACCLLQTNADFNDCRCALNGDFFMRQYALNNAVMMAFSFAASFQKALMIHASLVRHNGRGYAFTAQSGTGKSTQVSNWLRYIPDCDLMNDDNPVVRVIGEEVFVYGTPWSGKTPCYRDVKAPLAAVTRIERCERNWVEKLPTVAAFASFLPSCSTMRWDKRVFDNVCNCISDVIRFSELYTLHCLPDRESAEVCHSMIDHE